MTQAISVESLSDDELHASVRQLTARSNVTLADLLAHLGELEQRGIHRAHACASLYTYCIYELRMSEDAAFRRSKAARLVRQYPELRDAIAKGEIHLTGVLVIGPLLGGERHAEILRRACFRSKRELLRLAAEIDPKPEVPAVVEPIGPELPGGVTHRALVEALSGPVRELPPGRRPADWTDEGAEPARGEEMQGSDSPDVREPERPLRYKVQFTATQEFVDLLNEARDLLGHEKPRPTLPDVQLRALRALVKELRTQKRAVLGTAPERVVAAKPSTASVPQPNGRHIPARVRRAVWYRDGARCVYRDERGERCRESSGLEIHHRHAHAFGGGATSGNLELRCKAHNTLAAEEDFGREHMDWMRGVSDQAPRWRGGGARPQDAPSWRGRP